MRAAEADEDDEKKAQKQTREELIRQCRYYKGEEENPFDDSDRRLLGDYERI